MARIISTTGASSVVHDGKEYRPNRQGVFSVPNEVAEHLLAHGFVSVDKPKPVPLKDGEV